MKFKYISILSLRINTVHFISHQFVLNIILKKILYIYLFNMNCRHDCSIILLIFFYLNKISNFTILWNGKKLGP